MAKRTLTKDQKDRIVLEYTLAYEAANPGRRCQVVPCAGGWWQIHTNTGRGSKYRISQFPEMTKRLVARVEREEFTPEDL